MPIAFDTLSHGHIPIGFFNIDTDCFLIDNHFIFASDLCPAIAEWAAGPDDLTAELEMYVIENRADIGDLMGAINGRVFTGFIGELYKLYPFPEDPEGFRQKPEGDETREPVEKLLREYAVGRKVKIDINKEEGTIAIGEYRFDRSQFHDVIAYIWRGGMPKWKDGVVPGYVEGMMEVVVGATHWLFVAGDDKR